MAQAKLSRTQDGRSVSVRFGAHRDSAADDRLALGGEGEEERLEVALEREAQRIPVDDNREAVGRAGASNLALADGRGSLDRGDLVESALDL